MLNRPGDRYHAIVILDIGTPGPQLEALLAWANSAERWAALYRRGGENYDQERHQCLPARRYLTIR
jgi:hypothetical protein